MILRRKQHQRSRSNFDGQELRQGPDGAAHFIQGRDGEDKVKYQFGLLSYSTKHHD
jgi:hypothetical protein